MAGRAHGALSLSLSLCTDSRARALSLSADSRSLSLPWQEGHTAHATLEAAAEEVLDVLDLYRCVPQVAGFRRTRTGGGNRLFRLP